VEPAKPRKCGDLVAQLQKHQFGTFQSKPPRQRNPDIN
jgi:hypothetical protein